MKENKSSIRSFDEIQSGKEVEIVKGRLINLEEPNKKLSVYLSKMENLYMYDTGKLEKYLAVFSAWHNYLSEQIVISDVIRVVAESQMQYYYSYAVSTEKGSINEKKENARANPNYVKAEREANRANAEHQALTITADNCERGFRLASRILTRRLGQRDE